MKAGSVVFLCVFGLFWTGITGAFDYFIARGYYQQIRAHGFATTFGMITHSEVTQHHGSKGGTTYGVNIQYNYDVGGRQFEGNRYRYGGFTAASNPAYADETVQSHPVGLRTTVYYAPDNPGESVLSIELRGADLFLPLFMTPFNLIMLAIWFVPVNWLWRKLRPGDPSGAKTFQRERRIHVRLPRYFPITTGTITVGIAAFGSIFIVMFASRMNPGLSLMITVWTLVLGSGVGVALWQWNRQRSGRADLVIDPDRQAVQLPVTFDRKHSETIPASEVSDITVETIERRGSKGGVNYVYAVTLQRSSGRREKLTDWTDQKEANQLAAWLREKLAFAEPDAPPRKSR